MTKWQAEYNSLTGKAVFTIGDSVREMHFADFTEFNLVSTMLNAARKVGNDETAKVYAWRVSQVAREMGVDV